VIFGRRKNMRVKKALIFATVILIPISTSNGNNQLEPKADKKFEFVWVDKYFAPPSNKTIAILYRPVADDCNICPYNFACSMWALFGDREEAEKIIGKILEPVKLVEGRMWLEKIMNEYQIVLKDAEEINLELHSYGLKPHIVFITRNKGYIRDLRLDDVNNLVYDNYMESALLRKYFKEIGLISIRPHKADKYFIPPKDKTVSIFLYPGDWRYSRPVALFGDRELGEKFLYGDKKIREEYRYYGRDMVDKFLDKFIFRSLEPKKVFEGREWLENIMDAYEVALKQAKKDKNERIYQSSGSIVFLTQDEGYIRGIDVGKNIIGDDDIESEQLKKYFDELGLTKELLGKKPSKKLEIVPADNYFVPPADETIAILLCRWGLGLRNIKALIGDKALTEKLMAEGLKGKTLEPKKIIEGRDWLVKIADAYRIAIKDAKEKNYYRNKGECGYIWFITHKRGYIRGIGIDDNTVHDNYMESELLKKYFDELGITNELLAAEPNKVSQN
jgi:hypothetical protein